MSEYVDAVARGWQSIPRVGRRGIGVAAWAIGTPVVTELMFGRATYAHTFGIPFPSGVSGGILINGAILGMLYSFLAFGLILVYRANRIINFAHAGLGLVPAVTALLLITNHGWPYPASLAVMLVGSALVGGIVELAMRRFWNAPRLIATVVTIGFAEIFVYLELNLANWVGGRAGTPISLNTPYTRFKMTIGGFIFTGDYVAIVVAAVIVCAALTFFLRYTRAGIAIRASAENSDRARLLGVPVGNLSTIVWVIAGVCSGVAVYLQAPVTALPAGGSVSPLVLLYGLAAAIVGRMESLPIAFAAGISIGVLEQGAFAGASRSSDAAALMIVVIVGALLVQRRQMARAYDTGVASFRSLQEFRPIPVELRHLPEVQRARIALGVVVAGVVLAAPWIVGTAADAFLATCVLAAIVAVSLVVLSGWAGQISLGQIGFAGVGAAVAGGLATRYNLDFFVTLAAAMAAGAVLAIVIGIPALRVPGLFLAVVTLALAASVNYAVLSPQRFGWLLPPQDSYITRPNLYGRLDVSSDTRFYYVCLVFLVLSYAAARALRNSRSGRLFIGLRDNQRAAQSYGVNAARTKLAAFAISGSIAALAGALMAYHSQVDAGSFPMESSLGAFLYAVVGGLTSLPGAVGGTILFSLIGYYGGAQLSILATGVGAAFVLFVFPGGFAQIAYQTRDNLLRWVADRHGIHVPSLVADRRVEAADEEDADHVLRAAAEQMQVTGAPA